MSDVDGVIGEMSAEDLRTVDAAVSVIQEDCNYCSRSITILLRSIATDLLIAGQILSTCRGLPDGDRTKPGHVAAMTMKRQDVLQWDDLFHERSHSVCTLCQEGTWRCVEIWQLAKRL